MSATKDSNCETCGKSFLAKLDHGKWPRFCCRSCFLASCVRPEPKTCEHCGLVFMAKLSQTATRGDGRRLYCSRACASSGARKTEERNCENCGTVFYPRNITQNPDQKCCSAKCAAEFYRGANSHGFKGGVSNQGDGQKWLLLPRTGYVGKYMQEHRVIATRAIGRMLLKTEPIIHINNKKGDNRPENIFICGSISEMKKRFSGSLPWPKRSNLDSYK